MSNGPQMVLSGHETHPKQLTDTCTLRSVAILSALRSQAASSDHVHLLQAPERRSDARTKRGAMLMSRAALAEALASPPSRSTFGHVEL